MLCYAGSNLGVACLEATCVGGDRLFASLVMRCRQPALFDHTAEKRSSEREREEKIREERIPPPSDSDCNFKCARCPLKSLCLL